MHAQQSRAILVGIASLGLFGFVQFGYAQTTAGQDLAWNRILDIMAEDVGRLGQQLQAGGWDDGLGLSLATHLEVAALSMDDEQVRQLLDQAIAEHGSVNAFAAEVLTNRGLEQAMQARGLDGLPFGSIDEVIETISAIQAGDLSNMLLIAATTTRGMGQFGGSGVRREAGPICELCPVYREAARIAWRIATVTCLFSPGPNCAFAIGAAIALELQAEALCYLCGM